MKKMTAVEARQFLQHSTYTGKLATVRADGRPHVAPVWFVLDDETLVFTTWHESVKAANLRRDPRVSICVDEERPPFAFVMVEGTAVVEEQAADLRQWTTEIARRYMGDALAEAYGERNGVAGEWLVRVTIEKVVAYKEVAGW